MRAQQALWAAEYLRRRIAEERSEELKEFRHWLAASIAAETKTSRFRDRVSHERTHPTQHDIRALVNFVLSRRLRHPDAADLARRVGRRVDTDALRRLAHLALNGGATDHAIRERCARVLEYCQSIDAALAVGAALKEKKK